MERGGGGGEIRQRMTLLDQLSLFQHQPSSILRDLLKVRDDAGRGDPSASPAVTLAAVLASDKNSPSAAGGAAAPSSPRTLLDVIRDEESRDAAAAAGSSSWRELTDRLRIRHAAASWTAGSASSAAEAPIPAETTTTTIRVSLMTLMELREREEEERGEEEPPVAVADVEVEEEEDDVAEARRRDVCCVCMVRKKGAAFIPCGHTFCRLCSREMLAGRGNCPLCNAAIAEVLHIF